MKKAVRFRFGLYCLCAMVSHLVSAQQQIISPVSNNSQPPLFIENKGQFSLYKNEKDNQSLLFKVTVPGGDLYITNTGLSYVFQRSKTAVPAQPGRSGSLTGKEEPSRKIQPVVFDAERLDLTLLNASISSDSIRIAYSATKSRYNFYKKGLTSENVRLIDTVTIRSVYPGIDWVLYVDANKAKSLIAQDFILHMGADSRKIIFKYSRNANINLTDRDEVTVNGRIGTISESSPFVYEKETREPVVAKVKIKNKRLSYELPSPIVKKETIIDPDLFWGTAITSDVTGINYNDQVVSRDLQTDRDGNIFLLLTVSKAVSFPSRNPGSGAYSQDFISTPDGGMVIAKFSPGGLLLWSTFFGDATGGSALAIDPAGNVYAAGTSTPSQPIPLKNNGGYFDPVANSTFITRFTNNGQLAWSTNWSRGELVIRQMICDSKGNLYMSGMTPGYILPQKNPGNGAYFSSLGGGPFISEFSPANQLLWSTPIFESNDTRICRIALDPADDLYMLDDSIRIFNPDHMQTWTHYGVAWGNSDIAVDRSFNIFVVGFGPSPLQIPRVDPGGGAYMDNTVSGGVSTGFIMKYNPAHVLTWSTSFIAAQMTDLYRIVADKACDAVHILGVMNDFASQVPTLNSSCTGGFYFSPAQVKILTVPIFLTVKSSGQLVYCSLTDWRNNYYDQDLYMSSDPFGNMVYTWGHIFTSTPVPATRNPGNGAYFQATTNNVSMSSFLMKLTPDKLVSSINVTPPSDCSCNGSATIEVSCGAAPFNYSWSNGATTKAVTGLCSGNYSVRVTDNNCGDTVFIFTIPPAPGSITAFTPAISASHCNQHDGQITVSAVQGGTGPFQYKVDGGLVQSSAIFPGLLSGIHSIRITDALGCGYEDTVRINDLSGPAGFTSGQVAASCSGADGSITIGNVLSGTIPYTYSLNGSPFVSGNTFAGLGSGDYTISVKDAAGCRTGDSVRKIPSSMPPSSATTVSGNAHCGLGDGTIDITAVAGGITPYSYSLDGISFSSNARFTSLPSGNYTVYIRDNRNCPFQKPVSVPDASAPTQAALTVDQAACGLVFGEITIGAVSGGTGPYTYAVDQGEYQENQVFDSLLPGSHQLSVRDYFGCSVSQSFSVTASVASVIEVSKTDTAVCYGEPVMLSAVVVAGAPLRTYEWDNNSGTAATYSKTVTGTECVRLETVNEDGCKSGDSAYVYLKNCDSTVAHCVHFPNIFTPNRDGKNDYFGAVAHCGITQFDLKIYDRWGVLIFESRDLKTKWDGTWGGLDQPSGTYVYISSYSLDNFSRSVSGSFVLVR